MKEPQISNAILAGGALASHVFPLFNATQINTNILARVYGAGAELRVSPTGGLEIAAYA